MKVGTKLSFSYHLVENSPWPLTSALSIFSLIIGTLMNIHFKHDVFGGTIILLSLFSLLFSTFNWWNDIIKEGSYRGEHTLKVQTNLNLGFILFVISEISIFFSFFFAYFYNSLVPSVDVGGIWPPIGIETLDYLSVPLLNTAILFFSGIAITASQNFLLSLNKKLSIIYLFLTIILGFLFIYFQYFEYFYSLFTITDSVYGSSFFLLTGFHAIHVWIGVTFLIVTFLRLIFNHFFFNHSLGFNFSAIYYHFVDIVWLFLFATLYCWGSF